MASVAAVVLVVGTAGCSTTTLVDPPSALNGRGIDTAVNLYGPSMGRVNEAGREYYVWRRAVVFNDKPHACELHAEVGYRDVIRSTTVDGDAGACRMFWVQYSSGDAPKRQEDKPLTAGKQTLAKETPQGHWEPVGGGTETAAVSRHH